MSQPTGALQAAEEAYARGHWRQARDRAREADAAGTLSGFHLDLLTRALWFLGEVPESLPVAERAFTRYVAERRDTDAAALSLRLALTSAVRGDLALAGAWIHRARRLLAATPDHPVRGYLVYADAQLALQDQGDPAVASAAADELAALADRFEDPALVSFAGVQRGLGEILAGRTDSGFAALDEAMLPVVAGRVDPLWAGDIYCSVIHICEGLGDLGRMRAWTDALERWATPISELFVYFGVTRVHHLQLLSAEGAWDRVESELEAWSRGLVGTHGWLAGAGFAEVGDVRRLRGDLVGAAQAYAHAREQGVDPQPGEALLLHARGRSSQALSLLRAAIGERPELRRATLLLPAVEVALDIGEVGLADQLATQLADTADHFAAPGLRARADQARARVLLAQGRAADAGTRLEAAAAVYRQQRHRHAIARVHEALGDVADATGDPQGAATARATARAIYQRLGAAPDVARLTRESGPGPGGLTPREREVLACIALGAGNREVADRLGISSKTVERHLANIYLKLEVSTRTAAAAWAHEHRLG